VCCKTSDTSLIGLTQEEYSCDDVKFHAIPKEVDPEDWRNIKAYQLVEKAVHHPVEWTSIT